MSSGQQPLATAASRAAAGLPTATAEMLCRWIADAADLMAARAKVAIPPCPIPGGGNRLSGRMRAGGAPTNARRGRFVAAGGCLLGEGTPGGAIGRVGLDGTGCGRDTVSQDRAGDSGSARFGPATDHACQLRGLSYSEHSRVWCQRCWALRIRVVVETPDRIEGQGEYSTLSALGQDVANCAAVYFWPEDRRRRGDAGKIGILHVKCAVADGGGCFCRRPI